MRPYAYRICAADEISLPGCPVSEEHRSEDLLLSLAQGISADPLWSSMPETALVVRQAPQPVLAALGRFDEAAAARLVKLRARLIEAAADLRYVGYAQAEQDCERLAAQLLKRFGRDGLREFHFAAIPRGGLIVLGMLAYVLRLESRQLQEAASAEGPLVVVDDCALTGSRFGRFLQGCRSRDVVFAHLYSHPDLRSAIEQQEARVTACVGAWDLRDHAPERLGEAYAAWRESWLERLEPPRYWVGQPDPVCFAWSEPDRATWNPAAEQVEHAWRLAPPGACLKNRHASGAPGVSVHVQPEGKGPLRPSGHVLFGPVEDQLWVGSTQTGQVCVLSEVAADMWDGIVRYGRETEVVAALIDRYAVEEEVLRADLHAFIQRLIAQDLLVRDEADA